MKIYKTKFRKNVAKLKEFIRANDLKLLNLGEYIDNRNDKKDTKKDIIKQYKDYVPIRLIAREYDVTVDTIYKRLKKWGVRRRSGIRHLLGKMILEG